MKKRLTSQGYYLGKDSDNESYYLAVESFDCDWYWGFGYIQSKNSHQHADGNFTPSSDGNIFTGDFLTEKTFSEAEGWQLRELLAQFYTFRKMADLYHTGGAHVSGGVVGSQWKDQKRSDEINQNILPVIFKQVKEILEA